MKVLKIVYSIVLIHALHISFAQNCAESFYISKEGAKLTFESYDDKNKLQTTQVQTMKSFKNTAGGFEATMSVTMTDKKGKSVLDNRNFDVKCDNGVFKMDLSALYLGTMNNLKDLEMEISGEGITFPSNIEVGQELKSGETEAKMKSSGTTLMTFRFNEINRKVEKKESITTPAGTFDCYKIVSETDIKMIIKRTIKTTSWIAKGVGLVRTETYNKKGALENYMILSKLEK